jgi:DNA mismatch repair ATPase MutS
VREIAARLDEVRYTVHVQGQRVRVARAEDEPDYGAELAALFARFEFPARDHRVELATPDALDSVERRILDLVAKLFPDAFAALATADADFLDPDVARFEREIRFYLAYREHMARLALPFCIPELGGELEARDAYDLALATKLEGQGMVLNDVALHGGERVLVITGPNNGGKTSFARMVGGLHHLASLGVPVPARRARLTLPDRIFTHFEREEDAGKLEDDLRRVRAILELASDRSVVILNETFSATAHEDALALGTEVLERLIALGPLTLFVTFVDELSRLGDATVSLVATVDPDDPARRTHRVERRVADGRAYAEAIAAKYGLTYERLAERLAR